ncbi:hypothetical protein ANCDUO_11967 [Ancylostoma duodenale]|uniref:DUF19 domain-containing protein n=1 Tax=Ancylostoma duodenale TaxID=51022 RepID=A0A0C2CMK3_9BILA|nr:hypothetical protein ANCDUO_11967 [Ancylostoma duodenale]
MEAHETARKPMLIAKFNVCVREFRAQCVRHVTISLIDSSYGYLCNEGYNTFMESAECLMELDRKPAVKRCHDETLVEIETANTETGIAMAAKLDPFMESAECLMELDRKPAVKRCHDETLVEIETANTETGIAMAAKLDRMCG